MANTILYWLLSLLVVLPAEILLAGIAATMVLAVIGVLAVLRALITKE